MQIFEYIPDSPAGSVKYIEGTRISVSPGDTATLMVHGAKDEIVAILPTRATKSLTAVSAIKKDSSGSAKA